MYKTFFLSSRLLMVLFYLYFSCYTLHVNRLHVIFFSPCQSFNRRSPFNRLLNKPKAFLVAIPDLYASPAVTLHSRLPDVDVDPLTLVHYPARLFLRDFSSGHFSRDKNDGETGMRTLDLLHDLRTDALDRSATVGRLRSV